MIRTSIIRCTRYSLFLDSQRQVQSRSLHLSYTCVPAVGENQKKPTLVIAHGLFGSNQNWRTISKKINQMCGNQVICVDLRNHGDSEHHPSMTYEEMGDDILDLMKHRNIDNYCVLGHSLGGKVMMSLALRQIEGINGLVAVDMAPVKYHGSKEGDTIAKYLRVMQSVDLSMITTRKEVDPMIKDVVEDEFVRQFLLRNIIHTNHGLAWRVNLDAISSNYEYLKSFPDYKDQTFDKPTLFLGGALSNYIREKHLPTIEAYFPQAKIHHVKNAGHWVHAERPLQVVRYVSEFLNSLNTA